MEYEQEILLTLAKWHGQLMSAIAGHCLPYVLINSKFLFILFSYKIIISILPTIIQRQTERG